MGQEFNQEKSIKLIRILVKLIRILVKLLISGLILLKSGLISNYFFD